MQSMQPIRAKQEVSAAVLHGSPDSRRDLLDLLLMKLALHERSFCRLAYTDICLQAGSDRTKKDPGVWGDRHDQALARQPEELQFPAPKVRPSTGEPLLPEAPQCIKPTAAIRLQASSCYAQPLHEYISRRRCGMQPCGWCLMSAFSLSSPPHARVRGSDRHKLHEQQAGIHEELKSISYLRCSDASYSGLRSWDIMELNGGDCDRRMLTLGFLMGHGTWQGSESRPPIAVAVRRCIQR